MEFSLSFSLFGKKKSEQTKSTAESNVQVLSESSDFESRYGEVIRRVFREENDRYALMPAPTVERPIVAAGRVSTYDGYRNMLPSDNQPVPTDFNFQILRLIKSLTIWNPHFSMGMENIVTLGNTDYSIDFGQTKLGDAQAAKVRQFLMQRASNWYEFSSGEDSLDNDLLAQICQCGAISAEAVIAPNMRGIQTIALVEPEFIRFAYDKNKNIHVPLQESGGVFNNQFEGKYPGYIELNTLTYFYVARMRMGTLPYAIPPFCSAVESVFTETEMIKNFQNMMKRLGMMGFLSVLINAPQVKSGETNEAYQQRLAAYLETMRPTVERGFSRGVVLGYKDTHEFEVHSPMNPAAAEQAMNMIQALVFTGLKQDPNMHGKTYSVTEAFTRVLLEKLTLQVANFQKVLGTFKARAFQLELLLNGMYLPELYVKYKPAATSDEKRSEEIGGLKRKNLREDYNQGLIDQTKFANLLGYDNPANPKPLKPDQVMIEKTSASAKIGGVEGAVKSKKKPKAK